MRWAEEQSAKGVYDVDATPELFGIERQEGRELKSHLE